jgi:starch-binding outer membrane protein SusE/F
MKKILKTTIFALLVMAFVSCQDESITIVQPNGIKLLEPVPASPFVLSPGNGDNDVTTLKWDNVDNGVPSKSKYTIEIAKSGTNFEKPIEASGGVNLSFEPSVSPSYTWRESYLNSLLLNNGFLPEIPVDIDIRIKSILGSEPSNAYSQYSNTVTVKITPFTKASLAFTKEGQNPATAPKVLSSSLYTADCEGYAWLEAGNYKFYTSVMGVFQTSNPYYGDNGSGALVLNGAAINVATAGFYLIKSDTNANPKTYSITPIEWGIFGPAKPFPTGVNRKMIYNSTNKKWELTVILNGGKGFKFRNTATTLILGSFDPTKVGVEYGGNTMSYNGKDIVLPGLTPATYLVTLDLNSPRDYKYTLVKQ